MTISTEDRSYIIWQNRALEFYIAARVSYRRQLYRPAAFLAQQAIEQMLKGTLVWWDKSFKLEEHGHAIKKMTKIINNKVKGQSSFQIPEYFHHESRYQSVSRYPSNGKGILIPASFIVDLDTTIANLIEMVPFQFNSQLYYTLSGDNLSNLKDLRLHNQQIRRLRKHVGAKLKRKV
jgi:HEPN domain-containing protein